MKKISLMLLAGILAVNLSAQSVKIKTVQTQTTTSTSKPKAKDSAIKVANQTTATILKDRIKIMSSNQSIAVGLLAYVEQGVTRYMVEEKSTKTFKYLQYTLWIKKEYGDKISCYLDSVNTASNASQFEIKKHVRK